MHILYTSKRSSILDIHRILFTLIECVYDNGLYILDRHRMTGVTCEAGNAHSSAAPGSLLYWLFTGWVYFTHIVCCWLVGWLVVFNVPSTARSFRDGAPIYCPLRRTWSLVFTRIPLGIEPRPVAWQSITQQLRHAGSSLSIVQFMKVIIDFHF